MTTKTGYQDAFTDLYDNTLVMTWTLCMSGEQWILGFIRPKKIMVTQYQPRAMTFVLAWYNLISLISHCLALERGVWRTILCYLNTPHVSYHFGNLGTQGGGICTLKPIWASCHSPGPPLTSLRCPLKPPDFRNDSKASSVAPIRKPLGQGRTLAPSSSIFDPLGAPWAP